MADERTILIAEDDPASRGFLVATLEAEGYNVQAVADGSLALDALAATTPDLLVLDLMMPKIDGVTVLETVRRRYATRDLPVVVLTARDDELGEWLTSEHECSAYLKKPIDPEDLVKALAEVLDAVEP